MNIAEKIIEYKEEIESNKIEIAELSGKIKTYQEELKKLGCDSLEKAENMAKSMLTEVNELEEEIEDLLNDLDKMAGEDESE